MMDQETADRLAREYAKKTMRGVHLPFSDCCKHGDDEYEVKEEVECLLQQAFKAGLAFSGEPVITTDFPRFPRKFLKPYCDDPSRDHDGFLRKRANVA